MNSSQLTELPAAYYDQDDGINRCPACHTPRFSLLYRVTHFGFPFEFYRCECGLTKQAPMPNEAFFEWFFNSELFFSAKETDTDEIWGFYDYFKDESSRLRTSKRRFAKLSKLLNWDSTQSIMKIGPSTGTFLHVSQGAGHSVLGCDVSDRFIQYARETYGVPIDHGRFERVGYKDQQFDAVLLFNVVENVPNIEEFLGAIHRSLKLNGHFIINHVEMKSNLIARFQKDKYFLYRPPICYGFENETLAMLLNRLGFEEQYRVRDVRYLHIEKISTLLRWRWLLKLAEVTGISRIEFPVWAYPSWISVYKRVS
ncbi:MAG: class I SAM-dependent methyltransferase [Pseudomonadota bacterium]